MAVCRGLLACRARRVAPYTGVMGKSIAAFRCDDRWVAPAAWGLALAVLLAAFSPPAAAQWQWRGKDGSMNVSDRPPPRDVPDKDILKRPGTDASRAAPATATAAAAAASAASAAPVSGRPASAPPTALERETQAKRRAAEQELAAKNKAEEEKSAERRAINCRGARGNLATLESGIRIARTNEKGEREFLDDSNRASEMRRAREVIASDCR